MRDAALERDGRVRRELAVRAGEDREGRAIGSGRRIGRRGRHSGPPRREQAARPRHVVAWVRREEELAGRAWRRADGLVEALLVVLDEARRAPDDLRRAAMVRREVDANEARQPARQAEDAPHVGEAPRVDRLVVVADEEDVAALAGEREDELELRAVEVLRLVDEQRRAARLPPREEGRVGSERRDRARDEVVEVEGPAAGELRLVGLEDRDRPRVRAETILRGFGVELEAGERVVEMAGEVVLDRPVEHAREHGPSLHDPRHVDAGVGEDRPAERVERPDRDASAAALSELLERGVHPLLELIGRAPVERQGADRPRRRALDDPPRDPRDDRRRLAAPGGRHAEDRARRRDRRRTLVRREPLEAACQGWREARLHPVTG